MHNIDIAREIERLLQYAENHSIIKALDVIPSRNALMDLLQVVEPFEEKLPKENLESPTEILAHLLDFAVEKNIIPEDTVGFRDLLDAKIMGILMPRQSEIARDFRETVEKQGIERATDNFYAISKASNYIRMDRISKNLYWIVTTEYGDLEITINLSKPEKDPKEIAASRLRPQSSYPKCLLCIENVGFAGHINHPARQNHRVLPVTVGGEQWFLQYSPYVYYNEHCILFHEKHVPMKLSIKTFERLFDFIEQFPHYFIGSNADLPIVGGSILSHEHFQGGRHIFPMEEAGVEASFKNKIYKNIKASIVKWPMSVIRLQSSDKEELIRVSFEILEKWRDYSDKAVNIYSHSVNDEELIPHNTITPIARRNKTLEFEIDLVLRNNKTSVDYPDGIYHPHKDLHHIKKENIGLIEVMGLAVLPARLSLELEQIENILTGSIQFNAKVVNKDSEIYKHISWIEDLVKEYGTNCSSDQAKLVLHKEVGEKFLRVLMDSGVYKRDAEGFQGFCRFMNALGFEDI